MKKKIKKSSNHFKNDKKIKINFLLFNSLLFLNFSIFFHSAKDIKVALCTMGKMENLYVNEFVEYYSKLGIDHIFIYDDNEPEKEKISEVLNDKYKRIVSIFDAHLLHIDHQSKAFNNCYKRNVGGFDWFLMIDMDEFLFINNNSLKGYLTDKIFDKCDFIKFHWVITSDNDLLYYDKRPLFQRFKPPYVKSKFIKSIIRGNISDLKYRIHSPSFSPKRNITCNNEGKIIYYKNMNFESLEPININRAYIIHFQFKSTEEFVNKFKRGYSFLSKNQTRKKLLFSIKSYFKINKPTKEKKNLIKKAFNLNISELNKLIKYSR